MKKYLTCAETANLTCAETAKLIRAALKEAFPGVKFSVRSSTYSGGASITVGWTDGPTSNQVDGIVKVFEGSYFDGMTDYKGLNYSAINGEEVSFGADFVFTNRKFSLAFLAATAQSVCEAYKLQMQLKVIDNGWGAYVENAGSIMVPNANEYLDRLIYQAASELCVTLSSTTTASRSASSGHATKPSPTRSMTTKSSCCQSPRPLPLTNFSPNTAKRGGK